MTIRSKISLRDWWHAVLMMLLFCPAVLSLAANLQLVSASGNFNSPSPGGNGVSYLSMVTPDGRYVLFSSTANNLVPANSDGPVPGVMMPELNVFLRDRVAGTTTLVSVNPAGGSADEDCQPIGISTNGQYALFESSADNLTPGCTNFIRNIFVRDLVNNITTLACVSTNGMEGNGDSYDSAMTPDGRFVVFASAASNLVPNDANGIPDVFVRDLLSGTTTLVSTGAVSAGTFSWLINGSGTPQITPDGRYVAFYSSATNLVPGVQTVGDIYVRDLVAGTTTWASTNARSLSQSTTGKTGVNCYNPVISTNGQFVAFEVATNLSSPGLVLQFNLQTWATVLVSTNANVPPSELVSEVDNFDRNIAMTPDGGMIAFVGNGRGSSNNTAIYLWSAQTGTNILLSPDQASGLAAVGTCEEPVINSSGQSVAFLSNATNLTTNVITAGYHIYLWNLPTDVLQLVDAGTNGVGVGVYPTAISALSDDGSVFFDQTLGNGSLVPNDGNTGSDVLAFHPGTDTFELISGCQPTLASLTPNGATKLYSSCVSTNGRFVAFVSEGGDLLPNNISEGYEVFVRDLLLGTNILVSADTNGLPASAPSIEPSISGDGRYVAFSCYGNNLAAGVITNENVFIRDLQLGTTALVSVNVTNPAASGNGDSSLPTISSDGRYILFHSRAGNLAAASSPQSQGIENLYLRDQFLATNYALTTGTGFSPSVPVSMSPNGSYVAYIGVANGNSQNNLYVWSSQTARMIYTNTTSGISAVAISPDGSWIAYSTASALWAVNLIDGTNYLVATNAFNNHPGLQFSADDNSLVFVQSNHVYLHNFQAMTNLLVDRGFNSSDPASGLSGSPAISPNGLWVAYSSSATNIIPNDAGADVNIFLYDWIHNATTLVSVNLAGDSTANCWSLQPEFSGDGSTLVFQSYASDLVAQALNGFGAIFALNLSPFFATNSAGTNMPFYTQIDGITAPGQNFSNENPAINWTAVPGNSYQVQYANDLVDPLWQNVNGNLIFVGSNGQIIDLSPSTSQRFYRVIVVQ
ncbi:MAG TPA: hypothetical protein VGJ73_09780 [Verrucomicrobiae bacterium]